MNVADDGGLTPLHYAAEGLHKGMVEMLIAKGADVNAKDKEGLTPFDKAMMAESRRVIGDLGAKKSEDVNMDFSVRHVLLDHGGKSGCVPVDE